MGFREFITSRLFRQTMADEYERYENIKPPRRPSRRYIDKLVQRLLDKDETRFASKELGMIGPAIVPSLLAALDDPRFHLTRWPNYSGSDAPFKAILKLLVSVDGDAVLAIADRFLQTESEDIRKEMALHFASVARVETISKLLDVMQSDKEVASSAHMGLNRARQRGLITQEFNREFYDGVLKLCEEIPSEKCRRWVTHLGNSDANRAAREFAKPHWWSEEYGCGDTIVDTAASCKIPLPEERVRPIVEKRLAQAADTLTFDDEHSAAAGLSALTISCGDQAKPLLEECLNHPSSRVKEAAAKELARLAGATDVFGLVYQRFQEADYDAKALTVPQRTVLLVNMFEGEVKNGGLLQYLGNTSGNYAAETLEALRELGHPEALEVLNVAIEAIGPDCLNPDRGERLDAIGPRYDELRRQFSEPESRLYRAPETVTHHLMLYVLQHPEHFQSADKPKTE